MVRNITIDARWLIGGLGTYTRHLLSGLKARANEFQVHAITREEHRQEVQQLCDRLTVVNSPIYTIKEQWMVPAAARGCNLLHIPHYNAPVLQLAPVLITVHDLIHLTASNFRRSVKSWLYTMPLLELVTRKARHIITVSDYSRAQIIERLGVSPSKVTTIYNGVSREFQPIDHREAFLSVSEKLKLPKPYILYVGSLKPYKNVSALLKAFATLQQCRENTHMLVIVGDDVQGKRSIMQEIIELGIQRSSMIVPFVQQKVMPLIYAGADVCVMPSTIEGFGLPVLEAMACGTPVVSSRAASLPEIGGEAVLYFDSDQPDELAEQIDRILSSATLTDQLRKKGLERARLFTWEASADKHVNIYQNLLSAGC